MSPFKGLIPFICSDYLSAMIIMIDDKQICCSASVENMSSETKSKIFDGLIKSMGLRPMYSFKLEYSHFEGSQTRFPLTGLLWM